MLAHGPSAVVYAVCDTVVDGYERRSLESLQVDVDEVEESVFSPERTNDSARIYTLKREIAEVRRAVMPLREPMRRFAAGVGARHPRRRGAVLPRRRRPPGPRRGRPSTPSTSLLSTAFDAHMARISVQQNDDMRKISAGVGLVAAPDAGRPASTA